MCRRRSAVAVRFVSRARYLVGEGSDARQGLAGAGRRGGGHRRVGGRSVFAEHGADHARAGVERPRSHDVLHDVAGLPVAAVQLVPGARAAGRRRAVQRRPPRALRVSGEPRVEPGQPAARIREGPRAGSDRAHLRGLPHERGALRHHHLAHRRRVPPTPTPGRSSSTSVSRWPRPRRRRRAIASSALPPRSTPGRKPRKPPSTPSSRSSPSTSRASSTRAAPTTRGAGRASTPSA